MKKLNRIYKLLLVIPLVFFTNCDNSDDLNDVFNQTSTATTNTVFIETDDASEIIHDVGTLEELVIEVGVNNALEGQDVTVSFDVMRDGSPAVAGVDYTLDDAIIPAEANFGSSTLTMLTCGEFDVSISSTSMSSLVIAGNRLLYSASSMALVISIEWDDPFYDYDLYLVTGDQDLAGTVIESSFSTTNFESFTATPPEGFSSLYIDDWYDDNASIPVTLSIQGCSTETFDVVMDMDKFVLVIETTLDGDGNPVYDFTDLN